METLSGWIDAIPIWLTIVIVVVIVAFALYIQISETRLLSGYYDDSAWRKSWRKNKEKKHGKK